MLTESETRFRITPRVVLGLAVILLGVVLTLDNLGLAEGEDFLRFWPIALMALGLAKIAGARHWGGAAWGVFWLVAGGWLLLYELGFVDLDPVELIRDFWPLVLVAIGASLVWRAVGRQSPARTAEDDSTVSAFAALGAAERSNNSPDFRGGELTAFMGGCELDLRGASMVEGPAVLDVFAVMGGIEIRVPESWSVTGKVIPIMGAFEDKTRPRPEGGTRKRLELRGWVLMGGVEVTN